MHRWGGVFTMDEKFNPASELDQSLLIAFLMLLAGNLFKGF
jgi:hypothetical protein